MSYIIFDSHCDTISKMKETKEKLDQNKLHADLWRMRDYTGYIQVFAAFVEKGAITANPLSHCLSLIDLYHSSIEEFSPQVKHCENVEQISEAIRENKVAALLSVEGGEALEGDISALRMLYKLGVRMLTLTWNYPNEIADGALGLRDGGGLTAFGRQVVREMNRLGMVIDVSHLCEKAFWDVIEITEKPIVASHSNCSEICPHVRNLSKAQIRAIILNKGCIGINLYSDFLTIKSCATIDDVIEHIDYLLTLGAQNNIGLGCDFDGIERCAEGIGGVQDLYKLFNRMVKMGYSTEIINKIAAENFLRVMTEIL